MRSRVSEQIRINGNWEPKMFLKRRGDGTFMDVDALWEEIHSDAYLDHLLEIGATTSHIHFHKGYGLDAEEKSIQEAKIWAEKLHKINIKVGVYIGSTFFTETFNHPDMDSMVVSNDAVGWNSAQYFRKHWCYNSPYSVKYFQKVIRLAIEEVKADTLHFDTAFAYMLDQLCHCKYCMKEFKRFTSEDIPEIAGIAGFDNPHLLSPPQCGNKEYLSTVDELKEPGMIAWTLFHAKSGYDALENICRYARSLKEGILIFYNGCQLAGATRFSRPDMSLEKLSLVDLSCTEDCNENNVHVTDDGMPVSRFRAYKAGNNSKTSLCYYTVTDGENSKLMLAEAAAFNYNSLGFFDVAMQTNHRLEDKGVIKFVRHLIEHEKSFVDQTPWHNIAVLRHHESMLLNQFPCGLTPYVVEQALFEAHAPFSIINSHDLTKEKLADFEVLILPDSKSLSDSENSIIEGFVAGGGRLLAIGNSAIATNLNQFRKKWGLSKIFNIDKSPFSQAIEYDEVAVSTKETLKNHTDQRSIFVDYKKGKAAYISSLEFDIPENHCELNKFGGFKWYYYPYWKPAENIDRFLYALEQMLTDKLHITTDLPRHVGVEYFKMESGSYRIHIVNYKHTELIKDAKITIHNDFAENSSFIAEYLTENETFSKRICSSNNSIVIPVADFTLMETIEFKILT